MLRAFYSGISGMKVNQTKLDVIGNNIANVNTTAFKSGRVRFEDMLSQRVADAASPITNSGGINPSQVGLGVRIAGIDTLVSQGLMQSTGRSLDAGIDGDGYFMVAKGPVVFDDNGIAVNNQAGNHNIIGSSLIDCKENIMYTRDGAFSLDNDGNLVTSDGGKIMGYSLTNDTASQAASSVSPDTVTVGGFSFDFSPGSALNGYTITIGNNSSSTATSADVSTTSKTITLNGDFSSGSTMTASALQTELIKALDSAGFAQTVSVSGSADGTSVPGSISGGTPVQSIDTDGIVNFVDASKTVNSYDSSLKTLRIPDKVKVQGTSEYLKINSFTISKNGLITAVLEDGSLAAIGQIATANFKNTAGLSKVGNNLLQQTTNSGEAIVKTGVGTTGEDNSKGFGDINQGMLEMSNVDLAEQFTDMIVASRAFQASGKMINTGDEILQDIINLKR
jgi:flagellar hook protein FlgE